MSAFATWQQAPTRIGAQDGSIFGISSVEIFEKFALGVEAAGIAVIILGITYATVRYGYKLLRQESPLVTFRDYREGLGRTLLLALEFLVAADIVRTVAIEEPSFTSVGVLGLIILVRTFLSASLELEITGLWPWQKWRSRAGSMPQQGNQPN